MLSKILTLAKESVGIKELSNAHKMIVDTYNHFTPLPRGYKAKYTDSWCAIFVSYLSIKCGLTNLIPCECSCEQMIKLFKKMGTWQENESIIPNIGDIIFYDWQDNGVGDNKGWSDHVGIIENVKNGIIYVIEGNKNDSVSRREIKVNARYIRGYGQPNYPKNTAQEGNYKIALEVINGDWGNGSERKNRLNNSGFNYESIQSIVNSILRG